MNDEPFLTVRRPTNKTTHRSTLVKIAIVIISIALLACFGWFLKSDWFWFSWDIVGAVLVAAGCIAEWILLYEEEDQHSERNKRLEKAWALVVAAGVTMDVFGLIYGIPEAIKLENRVEELRAKNDELEAKWQWRTIDNEQTKNFIFLVEKIPKLSVRVAVGAYSRPEIMSYAIKIRSLLNHAGFTTPDSDTNFTAGVWRTSDDLVPPSPINEFGGDYLKIVAEGIGGSEVLYSREFTNNLWRPIVTAVEPQFAGGFSAALTESKIPTSPMVWKEALRSWLTGGVQCTVIVLEKPN